MIRFAADENFPLPSVNRLRAAGHDIMSAAVIMPAAKDADVLAWAIQTGRVILTFDRDFGELIIQVGLKPPRGIVLLRFRPVYPEEPAEFVLRTLEMPNLRLEDAFTVIDRRQVRQRFLPQ